MKNKLVSIIINCHNGEQYLNLAIESILNQTFTDFNFLIIDFKNSWFLIVSQP